MKPRDAILALLAEGPISGRQAVYDRLYTLHREDKDFEFHSFLSRPCCREVSDELDVLVGCDFVRREEVYSLTDDGRAVLESRPEGLKLRALIARKEPEVLAELEAWVDVPSAEAGGLGLGDLWPIRPPEVEDDFWPVHVTVIRKKELPAEQEEGQ